MDANNVDLGGLSEEEQELIENLVTVLKNSPYPDREAIASVLKALLNAIPSWRHESQQ